MDLTERVADNFRRARQARGYSLSDLARSARIAKTTLSQLETGAGNPTLATMASISDALGVPLVELMAVTRAPDVRVGRAAEAAYVYDEDGVAARYIARDLIAGHLAEIYEMILQSSSSRESRAHAAGVYERVIVTRGTLAAGPSTEPVGLKPGDHMLFLADRPHVYATSDVGARAICLVHYPTIADPPHTDGPYTEFSAAPAARGQRR